MKMKRIITLLLALVMAATALPVISVSAADDKITLDVGESLALDQISGSTIVTAEPDGNKYLHVQKIDYNAGEGISIKFEPATVGGTNIKNYYIRFKARVTNEEMNGVPSDERFVRLGTKSNVASPMMYDASGNPLINPSNGKNIYASTYPTAASTHKLSDGWSPSGYEKGKTVGDGGWTYYDGTPIAMELTNTSKAGEFTLFINPSGKVDTKLYAYNYANQAEYDNDPDKLLKGRWRNDHDVAVPIDFDDIQIGYFTDDRNLTKATGTFGDAFTAANGFVVYTTIDFEDGTLTGKDASGNTVATVSAWNNKNGKYRDVDGAISVALNTEDDYLRVTDMTAATSGVIEFDKPLDTGIYTLSGDFRLVYFQNTGRRFRIPNSTYETFDEGIHEATVTVFDDSGNTLGTFEINPWWDKDEVTLTLKQPINGLKLTITENGITEGDYTDYENAVDIMNLSLTLAESFNKEVAVGGGLMSGIKMYSTDSVRIETTDRTNSYLHIGNRNYARANDGVLFNTTATLEENVGYTITFRARQPLDSDNLVAISLKPLKGGQAVFSMVGKEYAQGHKDMAQDGLHCLYGWVSELHSAYGNSIADDGWYTYQLYFRPAETIENVQFALFTTYLVGASYSQYRREEGSSWKNMVNPIDVDDFIIYKGETVATGTKIYEIDFEDGIPASFQSAFGASVSATANDISLEGGEYYSIIGENGASPKMLLSDFADLDIGKYSISFEARIGAYDGEIDYDHNSASIVFKSMLKNRLDPTADLVPGGTSSQTITAEWTKITYEFYVKNSSELEQLAISFEALGEGYTDLLNRIDYRNFEMTHIPTEAPDIPYPGVLMLILKKRQNEKGDGNYLSDILSEEHLQYWDANGQVLEAKTEGEINYLAASGIKNNYSGFVYANGKTLKAGTYLFRADVRTSTPGEDTQLRITLGNITKKVRCDNEWVTFETVFDLTEETAVWLRFRGGPLAFYRQSFDIANVSLINLDELERGQTITVGGNLYPAGSFDDPTARYEWNGNASENNGWGAIEATRKTDGEGNGYVLVSNRAVNYQNLDLNTGVRVEKGRTYTIKYRIRTADHRSDSGMRVSATAGSTWYKLKVEGEGADDPTSSWYNSYTINGRWKEVTSQYVAESDGTLKIRFSGDTSANSVHNLEIDDIQVYLIFKGTN